MGDNERTRSSSLGFHYDQRKLDGAVVPVVVLESDAQEKHLPVF
jgi:hypothetical protein